MKYFHVMPRWIYSNGWHPPLISTNWNSLPLESPSPCYASQGMSVAENNTKLCNSVKK